MGILSEDYKNWILDLKKKIQSTQLKAALSVNSVLIEFYWEIGKSISEKENIWGSKLIEQTSKDLKSEFPKMKGLSKTNLKYCKRFYEFYTLHQKEIGQQLVDQLKLDSISKIKKRLFLVPWGHNIIILSKSKNIEEALFYIIETIENNWSRDTLDMQIEYDLFARKGKSINNFKETLPSPLSDLANQTLKDPYIFDFLNLDNQYKERDIENQLINHITKFLLELGKGFAFIGNQYMLEVENTEYFIDLLFYHTKLKCYVVIELKNTKFKPEFTGKLNFYLSAIDSLVKDSSDNPTIGILLCKNKSAIEAEFAIRDLNKPIGVSEINFVENLPKDLKSSLPTIEELEKYLNE